MERDIHHYMYNNNGKNNFHFSSMWKNNGHLRTRHCWIACPIAYTRTSMPHHHHPFVHKNYVSSKYLILCYLLINLHCDRSLKTCHWSVKVSVTHSFNSFLWSLSAAASFGPSNVDTFLIIICTRDIKRHIPPTFPFHSLSSVTQTSSHIISSSLKLNGSNFATVNESASVKTMSIA